MKDPAPHYKAALEGMAQVEESIASALAMLADELERQGQPETADMLQHRAASIQSRALAASLQMAG